MSNRFSIPSELKSTYRATFSSPGGEHFLKWLDGRINSEIEAAMNEGDAVNSSHRLQRAKGMKEAQAYIKVMISQPVDFPTKKS